MTPTTALARVPPTAEALAITEARNSLDRARERVVERMGALQRELDRATDWRTVIRKHPVAVTATVVVAGLMLFRLFRRG